MKALKITLCFVVAALLVACKSDPGPLAGTWQLSGLMPMTMQFRSGETEAMGMIDKVEYEVRGNDVIVTYTDGMAKGTAMRYTMTGPDTAKNELGILRRIR